MPGFGDRKFPCVMKAFTSIQFRVSNAYSFLNDLGKVPGVEVTDGEEE